MAKKKRISAVIGRLKGETTTTVQSVIFSPKAAWTVEEAQAWLTDHDFKAGSPDETETSYRFRQRDPADFKASSFRTIALKGKRKADGDEDKFTPAEVSYTPTATDPTTSCDRCQHFDGTRTCSIVAGVIAATGWCEEFEPGQEGGKVSKAMLRKFIPFAKVDEAKREVWGIVTAEVPDKEDEVCDYVGSKPHYEALVSEMSKATDGKNLFPLRAMHQLDAVGKGIGIEFRDDERSIFMGFKVVDDDAWRKVAENVYTGFSQGGTIVGDLKPDPVFKGCVRYVARPSECSLVDNPCLGVAHFTYVKADGSVELRKFSKSQPAVLVSTDRLAKLTEDVRLLKAQVGKAAYTGKLRTVAGEALPSTAFAYVGKADDSATWQLPLDFSDEATARYYARMALVKLLVFSPTVSEEEKKRVVKRVEEKASQLGLDSAAERSRCGAVQGFLRKRTRVAVNRYARKAKDVGHSLTFLDDNLGKLAKGLYDAGRLACFIQELSYILYGAVAEEEWEKDETSVVPAMLEENINGLLDSLVVMVGEEAQELREDLSARVRPA